MKVLLIRYHNKGDINTRLPESMNKIKGIVPILGLPYLAAVLEKAGHQVSILDALALNLTRDDARKRIMQDKPDIVGVTALTSTFKGALEAAELGKETGATVVMGGPHLAIFAQETLSYPSIDYGIAGEGEYSLLSLVESLEKKKDISSIPGLIYRSNGKVIENPPAIVPDLDALPFPARHLLPNDRYSSIIGVEPIAAMMLGRGCPYRCSFCFKHPADKKYRIRSVDNILKEIESLVRDYKVKEIMLQDDSLTLKRDVIMEMCRQIVARKIKVRWEGPTRVNLVDYELMKAMREAGCIRLRFGVDTGDEGILNAMHKSVTFDQIRSAFRDARRAGLYTFAYFIIGYLGETPDTVRNTIRLAQELEPDQVMFTVCTPYPGTPLFDACVEAGVIDKDYWKNFVLGKEEKRIPYLMKDADYWVKKAYRNYYLRPGFAFKHISKIRSWAQVKKSFQALKGLVKFQVEGRG